MDFIIYSYSLAGLCDSAMAIVVGVVVRQDGMKILEMLKLGLEWEEEL